MLLFHEPALVIRSAGPITTLIEFISFPHQVADFLIYPWKSIPSACFLKLDEFVYALLKSGNKLIPHALYCSGSKVRLFDFNIDIPHGLLVRTVQTHFTIFFFENSFFFAFISISCVYSFKKQCDNAGFTGFGL